MCVQVQYTASVLFYSINIQTYRHMCLISGPSLAAAMSEFTKRSLLPVRLTTVSVQVCVCVYTYVGVNKEALAGEVLFRAKVLGVLFIVYTKSKSFLPGGRY